MPALKFRRPQLKLRGKIIVAAALVFTLAIGASLTYVITASRSKDLATADQQIAALAQQRADKISIQVDQYFEAWSGEMCAEFFNFVRVGRPSVSRTPE